MTTEEQTAASMLRDVVFPKRTFDQRFGEHLRILMTASEGVPHSMSMINECEARQIWRMIWRYRIQIHHPERANYVRQSEHRMLPPFRTPKEVAIRNRRALAVRKMKRAAQEKEAHERQA